MPRGRFAATLGRHRTSQALAPPIQTAHPAIFWHKRRLRHRKDPLMVPQLHVQGCHCQEQPAWTDRQMPAQTYRYCCPLFCLARLLLGPDITRASWVSWQQVKSRFVGSLAHRQPAPVCGRDGAVGAEPVSSGAPRAP